MRILVLGRTGMLGHMVVKVLSQVKGWEIKGMHSTDFEIGGDLHALHGYDYIVNCIGVLAPVENIEQAIRVNALFPHELVKAVKGKVIQISTDGVFSGKGGPYDEDAPHDCLDIYGKTKSLGEVDAPNVLNIRTSIIGPSPYKKKGLLEWFLAQPDGVTVKGFTNHVWNGVTTLQFANLCVRIIREDIFDHLRRESHVFHFAPNEPVTKCELLEMFKTTFKKNVTIVPTEDPRGAISRVLKTKYKGIKNLFPHGGTMEEALKNLCNVVYQSTNDCYKSYK